MLGKPLCSTAGLPAGIHSRRRHSKHRRLSYRHPGMCCIEENAILQKELLMRIRHLAVQYSKDGVFMV